MVGVWTHLLHFLLNLFVFIFLWIFFNFFIFLFHPYFWFFEINFFWIFFFKLITSMIVPLGIPKISILICCITFHEMFCVNKYHLVNLASQHIIVRICHTNLPYIHISFVLYLWTTIVYSSFYIIIFFFTKLLLVHAIYGEW